MSEQTIVAIVSGIVGISVAVIGKTDILDRSRSRLLKDIELYNSLPKESECRIELLSKVDGEVRALVTREAEYRRDTTGIILGTLFAAAGLYLTWFFVQRGSWWLLGLVVSIFMLILGVVGFVQDVVKRERSEKGRPVKK